MSNLEEDSKPPKPKGEASGIPIFCAFDKVVDLVELMPNPRNTNVHKEEHANLLARIIKARGWRAPITVSRRSGLIIRGHLRLWAAKQLGVETAPVDYQDYKDEGEELADLHADNQVAELSYLDVERSRELVKILDEMGVTPDLMGYTDEGFADLMRDWEADLDAVSSLDPKDAETFCLIKIKCLKEDKNTLVERIRDALRDLDIESIQISREDEKPLVKVLVLKEDLDFTIRTIKQSLDASEYEEIYIVEKLALIRIRCSMKYKSKVIAKVEKALMDARYEEIIID